jgi:secreted trypsin-like serine protease
MIRSVFICSLVIVCTVVVGQLPCGSKPDQPPWPSADSSERIVGGRNATPGYWPWQLSLQFLRENTTNDFRHTCGASLIDPWWAMTAAHCVTGRMIGMNDSRREEPENFRVLVGATNLLDLSAVQIIGIDLITKHERFEPNPYLGYPNDIALLRLKQPADLSPPQVELACIPKDVNMNFTAEECWITGWGLMNWQDDDIPTNLQEAYIEAISNEQCRDLQFGYIRDSHICVGTGYPNACSGDSGGPMSCYKNQVWYVAGLTSWGIATCDRQPGVYTRISYFWSWIELTMALNPPPAAGQF